MSRRGDQPCYFWARLRNRVLRVTLLALSLGTTAGFAAPAPPPSLELWIEVGADGAPGPLWMEMLGRRLAPKDVEDAAALRRPLNDDQRAWADAIRARLRFWTPRMVELAAPFEPVTPPESVRIVLGNRGGDDAFTHDPTTIGFDLARLQAEYGDATSDENRDRLDRFFDHEYSHLLFKAWVPAHPQPGANPFELALQEMWGEGFGNYRSLSERWRATAGSYSRTARNALNRLEPILVDRMTALACATPEAAAPLVADLSRGPFDRKWGALPVALWLDSEASMAPDAPRRFVQEGVDGLFALALRRLPPELAARLQAAQAQSRACPR